MESFSALEDDFLRITAEIIWCTVTTVDPQGRPRSRVLHPIWQVVAGGPVGWVVTARTPIKARHLAANPHVACSYWSPAQHVVYVDCVASWVEEATDKELVWDLFQATPPPLGYDPGAVGWGAPDNPGFAPLRLDAWRVQLMRGEQFPSGNLVHRMWRAELKRRAHDH